MESRAASDQTDRPNHPIEGSASTFGHVASPQVSVNKSLLFQPERDAARCGDPFDVEPGIVGQRIAFCRDRNRGRQVFKIHFLEWCHVAARFRTLGVSKGFDVALCL